MCATPTWSARRSRASPAANVLGEPVGRNTAAAVALAAEAIDRPDDEVMIVLPADQAVRDGSGYLAALQAAAERAAGGDMVTLGIEPTEPSTGYGYVVAEGAARAHAGRPTYRVARFEEKPTPQRAAELIAEGGAYWNAGIFVWRRDVVRSGLAQPFRGHRGAAPRRGWRPSRGARRPRPEPTLRRPPAGPALLWPTPTRRCGPRPSTTRSWSLPLGRARSRSCRLPSAGPTWAPGQRCATTVADKATRS